MDIPLGLYLFDNKVVEYSKKLKISKRKVNNQNFLFCNIHSWIVNEAHRVSSHMLFVPLIKKKCAITVLSPLEKLYGIFRKMSFNILNMNYRVVFLINFFSFFNFFLKYRIEKWVKIYHYYFLPH